MKHLWERVLGPPPNDMQFALWLESYGDAAVRYGILQTAAKNLKLNGQMNLDCKIRFASSVMKAYNGDPRSLISTEREPNSQPQPPAPPPAPAPAPASIPKIDYAAIRANRLSAFLNAGADRAKRFQVATGAGDDAEREAVHAALVAEAQAEKRNYEEAEAADLTAEREAANQMPGYPTRSFGPPALPHEFLPTAQANFNLGLSDF